MMMASLAFAAALSGQDAMLVPELRPQDRRAECPAWLVQVFAESAPQLKIGACIWADTSDAAQAHYVAEIERAGWRNAGGLANVLQFRKDDACLGLAGFPVVKPGDNAIGSGRNLNEPRPADEPAVFLILPDKTEACPSVGDR